MRKIIDDMSPVSMGQLIESFALSATSEELNEGDERTLKKIVQRVLPTIESELKQAKSSADKLSKDAQRYAPQLSSLKNSLSKIFSISKSAMRWLDKSEDVDGEVPGVDEPELSEARVTLKQSTIDEIAELTDWNNHTSAREVGAKALKLTKYAKIFGHLNAIQSLMGETPRDLEKFESDISNKMFKWAKGQLSKEDYERFHGAY